MLSKLLSNINEGKTTSGEDTVSGSGNKEGGIRSSEQVFKSLLQSLQNEGSSGKAKQQLLALSGNSPDQEGSVDGENVHKNILGGSFSAMGEGTIENTQQADQNILKELQKEFKNIKNEFTGEETSTSSEGEGKGKADQKTDSSSNDAKQVEESAGDAKENTKNNSVESQLAKKTAENVEGNQKGQVQQNGDFKKAESEGKSVKKGQNSKTTLEKQTSGNSAGTKKGNIESANNSAEALTGGSAKNTNGVDTDGEAPKSKEQKESESSSNSSKSAQGNKKTNTSTDIKGAVQNGSGEKILSEQVSTKELQESKENTTRKKGIEKQSQALNSENKLFEKREHVAGRQVQPDVMSRSKEGQNVPKNPQVNSGSSQIDGSLNRGQTAKTELTEQQKKVMTSFFQKNSTSNISTKGLEMKGVQNAKEKKNGKGKIEAENSQRGFGKRSATEGRNKLLSRLGISGANAQKQAKPLDSQNFSGVSVGQSDSSLEEQKINWEEQLVKTMDSSSEKESKANSGSSSVRLGQMPITNVSLRKKILPGLTQRIQQAASSAKENGGNWQKHNFTLDDGKNIQLSVRESKGVLQIKMGSMNLDLSKFLQQNLQQIREHLRQEFGSDIDLQFEHQQQGEESQFFEDTESSDRKRNYRNNFAGESLAAENTEEARTKTVRNFGYNQMEWTA